MTTAVIEAHSLRWNGENVSPLQFIEHVLTDVSHLVLPGYTAERCSPSAAAPPRCAYPASEVMAAPWNSSVIRLSHAPRNVSLHALPIGFSRVQRPEVHLCLCILCGIVTPLDAVAGVVWDIRGRRFSPSFKGCTFRAFSSITPASLDRPASAFVDTASRSSCSDSAAGRFPRRPLSAPSDLASSMVT
jgi:hypothetical protein